MVSRNIMIGAGVVVVLAVVYLFIIPSIFPTKPPAQCPPSCVYGCIEGTSTCKTPQQDKCVGINCSDKCIEGVRYYAGICDSASGECKYTNMICPFGCEDSKCKEPLKCPSNCTYGCKPNTTECIEMLVCPPTCSYGCRLGTDICNPPPVRGNILNGNFETGNYSNWRINGSAFGSRPSNISDALAIDYFRGVSNPNFEGKYWASSYLPTSDRGATGTLTSDSFIINKPYLEFLYVGQLSSQVYVNLVSDGVVIKHLEPDNPVPSFKRFCWDVSGYLNRSATIKVVDESIRNYIEVDDFILLEKPTVYCGEIYVDPYRGFSIKKPENWVEEPGENMTIFYGPTENNFTVNIVISSEEINSTANLELYVEDGEKLRQTLPNYTLISDTILPMGGITSHMLVYGYSYLGFDVRVKEAVLFNPTTTAAYTLVGTALESNFATYGPVFEATFQTFKP